MQRQSCTKPCRQSQPCRASSSRLPDHVENLKAACIATISGAAAVTPAALLDAAALSSQWEWDIDMVMNLLIIKKALLYLLLLTYVSHRPACLCFVHVWAGLCDLRREVVAAHQGMHPQLPKTASLGSSTIIQT